MIFFYTRYEFIQIFITFRYTFYALTDTLCYILIVPILRYFLTLSLAFLFIISNILDQIDLNDIFINMDPNNSSPDNSPGPSQQNNSNPGSPQNNNNPPHWDDPLLGGVWREEEERLQNESPGEFPYLDNATNSEGLGSPAADSQGLDSPSAVADPTGNTTLPNQAADTNPTANANADADAAFANQVATENMANRLDSLISNNVRRGAFLDNNFSAQDHEFICSKVTDYAQVAKRGAYGHYTTQVLGDAPNRHYDGRITNNLIEKIFKNNR